MNYYPNYVNPYYQYRPTQFQQPMQQPTMQPNIPNYNQTPVAPTVTPMNTNLQGLQGKTVDSIDVVKAMDIPLDGTVSYFPLTDGTAIITKQLQMDGTSKTIVYKPINEDEISKEENIKYITEEQLDERLKEMDTPKGIEKDFKKLERQVQDLQDDFKDLEETFKDKKK